MTKLNIQDGERLVLKVLSHDLCPLFQRLGCLNPRPLTRSSVKGMPRAGELGFRVEGLGLSGYMLLLFCMCDMLEVPCPGFPATDG